MAETVRPHHRRPRHYAPAPREEAASGEGPPPPAKPNGQPTHSTSSRVMPSGPSKKGIRRRMWCEAPAAHPKRLLLVQVLPVGAAEQPADPSRKRRTVVVVDVDGERVRAIGRRQ